MKAMFFMLLFLGCLRASAQFQDLEQLKLDLEKLAQMKIMLSQAKQGYQMLQNGYNSVRDAAKGNYDLHKKYMDGQLEVSITVKHSPALTKILSDQSRLLKEYKTSWQKIVSSNLFTPKELADIRVSYQFVIDDVASGLETLDKVMTPGILRMSDAERLTLIEKVNTDVERSMQAVLAINKANDQLMEMRGQQKRDIDAVRRLHGLK